LAFVAVFALAADLVAAFGEVFAGSLTVVFFAAAAFVAAVASDLPCLAELVLAVVLVVAFVVVVAPALPAAFLGVAFLGVAFLAAGALLTEVLPDPLADDLDLLEPLAAF
jgi:hypothetical protein